MNEFRERLTDKYVDELIDEIDDEARSVDSYEYGLPCLFCDSYRERFRLIVRKWAFKNNLTKEKIPS